MVSLLPPLSGRALNLVPHKVNPRIDLPRELADHERLLARLVALVEEKLPVTYSAEGYEERQRLFTEAYELSAKIDAFITRVKPFAAAYSKGSAIHIKFQTINREHGKTGSMLMDAQYEFNLLKKLHEFEESERILQSQIDRLWNQPTFLMQDFETLKRDLLNYHHKIKYESEYFEECKVSKRSFDELRGRKKNLFFWFDNIIWRFIDLNYSRMLQVDSYVHGLFQKNDFSIDELEEIRSEIAILKRINEANMQRFFLGLLPISFTLDYIESRLSMIETSFKSFLFRLDPMWLGSELTSYRSFATLSVIPEVQESE